MDSGTNRSSAAQLTHSRALNCFLWAQVWVLSPYTPITLHPHHPTPHPTHPHKGSVARFSQLPQGKVGGASQKSTCAIQLWHKLPGHLEHQVVWHFSQQSCSGTLSSCFSAARQKQEINAIHSFTHRFHTNVGQGGEDSGGPSGTDYHLNGDQSTNRCWPVLQNSHPAHISGVSAQAPLFLPSSLSWDVLGQTHQQM